MRRLAFLPVFLLVAFLLDACGSSDEVAAPVPVETSTSTAAAAPATPVSLAERGAVVFKKCQTCHTLGEGERNKVGPNLWNVFGQMAGAREDFNYSKAMAEAEFVWDDTTMDGYLERPSKYLPGGRMSFVGLKKPEDREAVIAYMKEQTTPD